MQYHRHIARENPTAEQQARNAVRREPTIVFSHWRESGVRTGFARASREIAPVAQLTQRRVTIITCFCGRKLQTVMGDPTPYDIRRMLQTHDLVCPEQGHRMPVAPRNRRRR